MRAAILITTLAAIIVLAGCKEGSDCTTGTGGCECTPGGLCDSPNVCVAGTCVPPAADTSTDGDAPADTGADDATAEVECAIDGDCDDSDPCTVDACDLDYNECTHDPVDADGDGYPASEVEGTECVGGTDCDDGDALTGEQECSVVNECCDGCKWIAPCWYDDVTTYVWENPTPDHRLGVVDAFNYCRNLDVAGIGPGEWHLPTISELRTLLRGCPAIETGGVCNVTDDCLDGTLCFSWSTCVETGCNSYSGPGENGCYWDTDIEMASSMIWCGETWSSSIRQDIATEAWFVSFCDAGVLSITATETLDVRCVHTP